MKDIVILGINPISQMILQLIDRNKCKITAFITNEISNKNKFINKVPVIYIDEIKDKEFDYVIKTSDIDIDVNEQKIVDILKFLDQFCDFQIFNTMDLIESNSTNIDGFITGLSYAQVGIDTSKMKGKVLNLATSSQDLFYDYEIAKYLLSSKRHAGNIKFCFISLSYYSFDYDLSKCSLSERVYSYYLFLKTIHNKCDDENICEKLDKLEKVFEILFVRDSKSKINQILKVFYDADWNEFISGELTKEKIEKGKENAIKDSNKDYPETVEENVQILEKYIKLLQSKNIKPYFIVAPVTKYYSNYLDSIIKERFNMMVNNLQEKYNVEIYDYFDDERFVESDFYDVSHLNRIGAAKFTKILNDKICSIY